MQKTIQKTRTSSPTLDTIRMVEQTLQNAPNSLTTIPELKRLLPRQVNHNTLKLILDYLQENGKIYATLKGITWTENNNPQLRELLKKSWEYVRPGHFIPYREKDA